MILSNLYNISGEFMSHDGRMLSHVVMDTFMLFPEYRTFVGRHTDAVRNYPHQDLVIRNLRKFELLQS